jgi:hypothetical protein
MPNVKRVMYEKGIRTVTDHWFSSFAALNLSFTCVGREEILKFRYDYFSHLSNVRVNITSVTASDDRGFAEVEGEGWVRRANPFSCLLCAGLHRRGRSLRSFLSSGRRRKIDGPSSDDRIDQILRPDLFGRGLGDGASHLTGVVVRLHDHRRHVVGRL